MEFSIKSLCLFSTLILTGLSAGLFYAWTVSVIPGTKKLVDVSYLESMQSINRAILNPGFFISFFGSFLLLSISTLLHHNEGSLFIVLLSASLLYLAGTIGVTVLGNVPLNNLLDALDIDTLSITERAVFRASYEKKWNNLHWIRTGCSILSFVLLAYSLFMKISKLSTSNFVN